MPEQPDKFPSCDVCGRTILKGEQVHDYVAPQGQRLSVCVLCRSQAEASGWIPADQFGAIPHEPPGRARRGQALRQRLGRAAARARGARRSSGPPEAKQPEAPTQSEAEEAGGAPRAKPAEPQGEAEKERRHEQRPKPRPPRQQAQRNPKRQPTKQPAQRRTPRPRRGPEAIMRRAVERFNSSEERRKVAGLIRSLGEPQAAVRPDASRQLALVTVAWELSWYQWEVSGDGDGDTVREVAQGKEVSELAEESRTWNAAVDEEGNLRLRSGGRRRKPSAKEA